MSKKVQLEDDPYYVGNPKPCPWCGGNSMVYVNGSYVEGWTAFVECDNRLKCGSRGPTKQTKCLSNDEYVVQNQAVDSWNTVISSNKIIAIIRTLPVYRMCAEDIARYLESIKSVT